MSGVTQKGLTVLVVLIGVVALSGCIDPSGGFESLGSDTLNNGSSAISDPQPGPGDSLPEPDLPQLPVPPSEPPQLSDPVLQSRTIQFTSRAVAHSPESRF